jgi:hypothetical protein
VRQLLQLAAYRVALVKHHEGSKRFNIINIKYSNLPHPQYVLDAEALLPPPQQKTNSAERFLVAALQEAALQVGLKKCGARALLDIDNVRRSQNWLHRHVPSLLREYADIVNRA